MKKMVSFVLLICCVLLGCDAGHSHRSAGAQGLDDLLKIVSVAVPHQSYMDLRLDSITVLETDPYGRRLFRYHLAGYETWYLISQKSDASHVYYFEDSCYVLCPDEAGVDCENQINWLKETNDWNMVLDERKMQSVPYTEGSPDIDIPEVRIVGQKIIGSLNDFYDAETLNKIYDSDIQVHLNGLEHLNDNDQVIMTYLYPNGYDSPDVYLVLYDHNEDGTVAAIKRLKGMEDIRQQIIVFKKENSRGTRDGSFVPSPEAK